MRHKLQTPLLVLALFLAAWLPRVLGLDVFVTIDERKWLARSANFYQAVTHQDWAHTFQRGHPGVTIMWAGMLGLVQHYPSYSQEAPGQFTWEREHFEAWLKANSRFTPLALLAAGRWWVTLLVALIIVIGYFPLRRLLGDPAAALATLFIAWDPFAIALSRQLHPDGFVAVLTFLALLLFLSWLYAGRQARYLVSSGLVMGLAWLTKTPAIFLAPAGGVLIALEIWRWWQSAASSQQSAVSSQKQEERSRPLSGGLWTLDSGLRTLLTSYVLWGLIALATFVLLWPAMWVDPLGTLGRMAGEMGEYVERHTTTNFFWGQPTDDPGLFFYPVALLFRLSPAVTIGLLVAAAAAWRRRWPLESAQVRQPALALAIFALFLTVGMTIGAKKFDRYILPIFPALAVLATLGWLALGHWVIGLLGRWRESSRSAANNQPATARPPANPASALLPEQPAGTVLSTLTRQTLTALVLLHFLPGLIHYPYYLTYYNPLTGGSQVAVQVLFAGWGEGMDEAARWLNQQPNAQDLRVVAWYADGPFSYLFQGQPVEIGYSSQLFWIDTDYTVLYINQWQRQLPTPAAIAYFLKQPPVHTVRAGGMDLAYIYDMRHNPLPDFVDLGKESAADFGGQIRLAAYDFAPTQAQPGERLASTLYLQSLAPMTVNYNRLLRLVGPTGQEIWRADGWPWGAPTSDWPRRELRPDGHEIVIPADAAPGLYQFVLSFYDPTSFDPLPVTAVQSAQVLDPGQQAVALLQVGAPAPTEQEIEPPWHFGRSFALTGRTTPATAQPGADLALRLAWSSRQRSPLDYTVFVHVVDARGETVVQEDRPPLHGFAATRLWQPGQQIVDDYAIKLPADLPAGQYDIQVGLYTLEQGRLPVTQVGQSLDDFVVIGSFTVE